MGPKRSGAAAKLPMTRTMAKGPVLWLVSLAVIAVAAYLLPLWTGSLYVLLFAGGPALVGFLLALALPVRERWLLAPALALALAYWIWGWVGDAYDIGREGLVLVTGVIGAWFLMSWFFAVRIGRSVRNRRASRLHAGRSGAPSD